MGKYIEPAVEMNRKDMSCVAEDTGSSGTGGNSRMVVRFHMFPHVLHYISLGSQYHSVLQIIYYSGIPSVLDRIAFLLLAWVTCGIVVLVEAYKGEGQL